MAEGLPGSGGRPRPTPNQQRLPPYLEESIDELRAIPGDIYKGAKETITEAPERYASGYASVNRAVPGIRGALNRVIAAPLMGMYKTAAESEAWRLASDISLSGYLPVGKRGIESEPVRSMERDIRPDQDSSYRVTPPAIIAPAPSVIHIYNQAHVD